ncbi:MAG: site-specific integrase [Desulfobacteraceae bacterium]|nr:site-specific integrase [Desulfobacteraceae bacterium]
MAFSTPQCSLIYEGVSKRTFSELADWYLDLSSVKRLASYARVEQALTNFNIVFGKQQVGTLKPIELEEYQNLREKQGYSPATIDMEISIAKTMIAKAFDNDMVDGRAVKAFRKIKRKLKKAGNARKETVGIGEYLALLNAAPAHLQAILKVSYNTGMRLGEIRTLIWSYIDRDTNFIRLPADITKERKPKTIPINRNVKEVLAALPRASHHDFVFTYKNEPIRARGGLKRSFSTACRNANIPCGRGTPGGITLHDIRRTVKTNMLNAGVNKVHRDLILGHALLGMDAHYIVVKDEDLQAAMEIYATWLDDQINLVNTWSTTTQKQLQ